jgi:protein-L-isoaspartate(D-aspartate) O-methyltransferase
MIEYLSKAGVLSDERVKTAMENVDRADFVQKEFKSFAYRDTPLPIGWDQTISAPHMVAIMTQHLQVREGDKILEVGAGSGYQAAVLAELAGKKGMVISVERVAPLAINAQRNLYRYKNIEVVNANGAMGFKDRAPFNRILVTCSAKSVPEPLKDQLAEGGRMVIPVGETLSSILMLVEHKEGQFFETDLDCPCSFVPMLDYIR